MAELNSQSTEVVAGPYANGDQLLALRPGSGQPDKLVKVTSSIPASLLAPGTYATPAQGALADSALQPGDGIPWTDVTGKPSTFAPSAHSHTIADVTGLQTALDGKQAAGSYATGAQGALAATALQPGAQIPWTDVTGKPSTFTPSAHSHAIADTTGLQVALDGKAATSHSHSDATTSAAGFLSAADKTKLDGIAAGAQVNVPTDLSYAPTTRLLSSSTGADATLPLVSSTDAGLAPASGGGTTNFLRADGSWAAPAGGGGSGAGKQTIFIPAAAMVARITNGPSDGIGETATNRVMRRTLDFDATTAEFAQFAIAMPKSWNEGTITFQPLWSHAATTTNFGVVWTLAAVAHSDADALEAAFGTAVNVTDTGGTTDTLYIGPESSAVTIAGTPAEMDQIVLQIGRLPTDGADTMAIDARLHGVRVYYTATTGVDD